MTVAEVAHISEKPWSAYTEADYTIEQWHAACLIHLHSGPPTSKAQCKLPVKTPNGALNRNGVHAAAAALAGARAPLQAPPDQKAKAASALRRYYSQLGETPPDSLKQSAIVVEDILQHHGVKGMKWGVRNRSNGSAPKLSRAERKAVKKDLKLEKALSSRRQSARLKAELHNAIQPVVQSKTNQINAKPEYQKAAREGKLNDINNPVAKKYVNEYNQMYLNEMNSYLKGYTSATGRTLHAEKNLDDFLGFSLKISEHSTAKHAEPDIIELRYVKDNLGRIIGVELVPDAIAQGELAVDNVLAHFGVKGMKWGVRKAVHPAIADVPKKTRKEAAKDAEEFTRAKMFFGEGAGTRRKLIKATVEAKKKRDPHYAKAFDHFVEQTNLAQRAHQARKERRRKDTGKKAKRTFKTVARALESQAYYSDVGEEFLEHHGIKGMKWGVRRDRSSRVSVAQTRFGGRRLKTTGGYGHKPSAEAVSSRKISQIAKKSGTHALSNKQLEEYNRRLNLEQNFQRLQYNDVGRGKKFVRAIMRKKGPGLAESAGKAALNHPTVKMKAAKGAAALAMAMA